MPARRKVGDVVLENLVQLNEIRNITHHRPKWPASKDQVSKAREINKQLMGKYEKNLLLNIFPFIINPMII